MDEIKELIKNGKKIGREFTTHRGDNRDNMKYKGFSVGDEEHSKENSALMCNFLDNLTDEGLEVFCCCWKNKGMMSKEDIRKYTNGKIQPDSITALFSKGYLPGISTNLDGCQYGNESYKIKVPKPDDAFECVKNFNISRLYKGTVGGNPVYFTVIRSFSDYEVDFFTEIPADWISRKQ